MPTVGENLSFWDEKYLWPEAGDEWSQTWGTVKAQWYAMLLPRVFPFLPCRTILEIAPGHGRWTSFLRHQCEHLHVVDLSKSCIEHCQERFADATNIHYHVTDGRSLSMIEDNSIDFVFSFDSLVHVERDVLEAYLAQLATKLVAGGSGFIHHSNLAALKTSVWLHKILHVPRGKHWNTQWRGNVSAVIVRQLCRKVGLRCSRQEAVNWQESSPQPIDCFTWFTKTRGDEPPLMIRNSRFMQEARAIKRLARESQIA
jgi:predicted TPR repeat methyltransferase